MPLAAPAMAVLAIFSIMWRWNDFPWPLTVPNPSEVYTLQVGLNAFQGELDVQWHFVLAITVVTLIPVVLVFAFLQRFITTGIATTGMKKLSYWSHLQSGSTLRHQFRSPVGLGGKMTRNPLIFLDPHPRTRSMVFPPRVSEALGAQARVMCNFGPRAPDELVEAILPEVSIIVGQTRLQKARLAHARNLKAILNVKGNWEPDID